jgi:hypothetical protein
MAALIVLICVLGLLGVMGTISMTMIKVSQGRLQARQGDLTPRLEALEAENRDLRARVETLETIVTDHNSWDARFAQATGAPSKARLPDFAAEAPEVHPAQVAASKKG